MISFLMRLSIRVVVTLTTSFSKKNSRGGAERQNDTLTMWRCHQWCICWFCCYNPGWSTKCFTCPGHARGVMAILVYVKKTRGIIACTNAGVLVNRQTKREWWFTVDGYVLKATHKDMTTLSPQLAEVQKQVLEGTFLGNSIENAVWHMSIRK